MQDLDLMPCDDYTDLKVNIPTQEIDKIIKEYKKIKKYRKSSLFTLKQLDQDP